MKSIVLIIVAVAVMAGSSVVYSSMNSGPTREDCRRSLRAEYATDNGSAEAPSVCFNGRGNPLIKPLEGAEPGDTLIETARGFRVNSTGRTIRLD